MRARARDLEALRQRYVGLALQRATNDLHQRIGQVGKIAQGLVLDRTAFAVAVTEQVGAIDPVLVLAGCSDDVGGSSTCSHTLTIGAISPNVK